MRCLAVIIYGRLRYHIYDSSIFVNHNSKLVQDRDTGKVQEL